MDSNSIDVVDNGAIVKVFLLEAALPSNAGDDILNAAGGFWGSYGKPPPPFPCVWFRSPHSLSRDTAAIYVISSGSVITIATSTARLFVGTPMPIYRAFEQVSVRVRIPPLGFRVYFSFLKTGQSVSLLALGCSKQFLSRGRHPNLKRCQRVRAVPPSLAKKS